MLSKSSFLSILLLCQIVLTVILFATEKDSGAFVSNEKLFELTLESIDRIEIENAEKKRLVMEKEADRWLLPDYFRFPVSNEKLDRVFGKLLDTRLGWPVATTKGAEKRFRVANDDFERRLSLSKGDSSTLLYLGTSPGFKKIHARLDGQSTIYGIDFSAYEASAKAMDWADQSLLNIPRDQVESIGISGIEINHRDGQFAIGDLGEGETAVDTEVQSLVNQVSTLGFQEVLGTEDKPEYHLASPYYSFKVVKKDGETVNYRFGKGQGEDEFVLKSSASDFYFKIAKYNMDALKVFDRGKLVKPVSKDESAVEKDQHPPAPESPAPEAVDE